MASWHLVNPPLSSPEGKRQRLIDLPKGMICYQLKDDKVFRCNLTDKQKSNVAETRYWSVPHAIVKWKVWLGYDRLGKESRVWVEGPFCPQCLYELDRDRAGKKWHCLKCNKHTPIPKNLREDTIEKMIKVFTANLEQLKRQKHNNLSSQP